MIATAIAMFGWLQYCSYCRTHVFVQVVDQVSGKALIRFDYRVRIITSDSLPDDLSSRDTSDFSDWTNHQGDAPLVLKIPECCRLEIKTRSLDLDGGYEETNQEELFLPELPHTLMIRMQQGMEIEGVVCDAETKKPIQDVTVSSGDFQDSFACRTDSDGRFRLRNVRRGEDIVALHREYQLGAFATNNVNLHEPALISLTRAKLIVGRVCCSSTGEPIAGCTISQPMAPKSNGFGFCGCFAGYSSYPDRKQTTDQMGRFDFYFDDAANSTLEINKPGWIEKWVDFNKANPNFNPISLDLEPYLLRGSVVNKQGDPVTEFELQVEINDGRFYRGHKTQYVENAKGAFELRGQKFLNAFSIRSKSDGVFHHRISQPGLEERHQDLLNLEIELEEGFSIKGHVLGNSDAIKLTEVVLLRGFCDRNSDLALPSQDSLSCWKARVSNHGDFYFDLLTDGEYTLVTLCNGYVVNKRPVTISGQDVNMRNIELPPLLNVTCTMESRDGLAARIRSFELECEGHITSFRTNSRGVFALANVPAGSYTLKHLDLASIELYLEPAAHVITFSENKNYPISLREFPVIEVDSDTLADSIEFKVDYTEYNAPKPKSLRSAERDPRLKLGTNVVGRIDAGISFKVRGCDHQVNAAVDVNTLKGPSLVLLRPRELVIDYSDKSVGDLDISDLQKHSKFIAKLEKSASDPFSDEYELQHANANASLSGLSAKWNQSDHQTSVYFICDGEVLSKITAQELPETLTIVLPDRNPKTCIIHNPQLGWAKIDTPEVTSDGVTLSDVRFTSGVNVTVQCSLEGMPVFPSELRMCHSTGAIIRKEFDNYHAKEIFEFPQMWPGRWSIELIGMDPYQGELILDRHEVFVGNSNAISIELGSGEEVTR